jgi:hypothetical protein
MLIADLRAEAVHGFMPRAGVVDGYPRGRLQFGAQHVTVFGEEAALASVNNRRTSRLEIATPTDCNRPTRRGNVVWPW